MPTIYSSEPVLVGKSSESVVLINRMVAIVQRLVSIRANISSLRQNTFGPFPEENKTEKRNNPSIGGFIYNAHEQLDGMDETLRAIESDIESLNQLY